MKCWYIGSKKKGHSLESLLKKDIATLEVVMEATGLLMNGQMQGLEGPHHIGQWAYFSG